MEITNFLKKILINSFFLFFIIGLILFVFPKISIEAASDPPKLLVLSPQNGSNLNELKISLNGTVSNIESAIDDLKIFIYFDSNPEPTIIDVNSKNWKFVKELLDGSHVVKFELKDGQDIIGNQEISFFVVGAHGNYSTNTQACANCHNTHTASGKGLSGGSASKKNASNLCMACHDGTTSAPTINEFNQHNLHQQIGVEKGKIGSCTGCHDPHMDRTPENPFRLKEINCEACPEDKESEIIINISHYRTLYYKKGDTAIGTADDYSFCFQCHNGVNSNIEQYYKSPAIITKSGHNVDAENESPLNGQMPCSDCHDTHGSSNIKALKKKLGDETRNDDFETSSNWSIADERNFCLKCHNGNTEMYGKNVTFSDKNLEGTSVSGHESDNNQACSDCHGDGSSEFLERSKSAAHAPIKGSAGPIPYLPPTPPPN
jgi:predicted CXXCH cytochrome family protein